MTVKRFKMWISRRFPKPRSKRLRDCGVSAAGTGTVSGKNYDNEIAEINDKFWTLQLNFVSLDDEVGAYAENFDNIDSRLTAMDTKVSNAETTANNAASQVSQMQTTVTGYGQRIQELENQSVTFESRIADVEAAANNAVESVLSLADSIVEVRGIAEGNTAQISQMQTTVTGHGQRIETLETTVGGFEQRITDAETTANNAASQVSQMQTTVTGYGQRIETLETTVGGFDQRITDAETAANNAVSQVSQMQTTVTGFDSRIADTEAAMTTLQLNFVSLDDEVGAYAENFDNIDDQISKLNLKTDRMPYSIRLRRVTTPETRDPSTGQYVGNWYNVINSELACIIENYDDEIMNHRNDYRICIMFFKKKSGRGLTNVGRQWRAPMFSNRYDTDTGEILYHTKQYPDGTTREISEDCRLAWADTFTPVSAVENIIWSDDPSFETNGKTISRLCGLYPKFNPNTGENVEAIDTRLHIFRNTHNRKMEVAFALFKKTRATKVIQGVSTEVKIGQKGWTRVSNIVRLTLFCTLQNRVQVEMKQ